MNALIDLDNCRQNMTTTRKLSFAKIILVLLLPLLFSASVNGVRWIDEKCMTDCMPYKSYHYCYTGWTEWIHCKQILEEDDFNEVYYPTIKEGVWCKSRCKAAGYSYEWCFTDEKSKNWAKCRSEGSIDKSNLNYVVKYLRNHDNCNKLRKKRGFDVSDVHAMASRMLLNRQYTHINVNIPSTSITDYTTMRAPSLPNHDDIEITVRIRARIRFEHLQTRTAMPSSLTRLMRNMDQVAGDERGHLIAASLGGTNDAFNIVPQHRTVNRRTGGISHWFTFENEIRAFVNRNRGNKVDLHVIIGYGDLLVSRRPTGFHLQAIFYNPDGSIYIDTGSCYFSNNPDGPSLHEPDMGFSRTRPRDELKLRDERFDTENWN